MSSRLNAQANPPHGKLAPLEQGACQCDRDALSLRILAMFWRQGMNIRRFTTTN